MTKDEAVKLARQDQKAAATRDKLGLILAEYDRKTTCGEPVEPSWSAFVEKYRRRAANMDRYFDELATGKIQEPDP